ncbi:MAG: sigma 54-interacting transcriptional regulator [Myxococcales bacterium]|nr:sigma 54-interacting transcriptional regulator [Myxococcales bacterium]
MAHLQFHDSGRPMFVQVLRPGRTMIGRSDTCDLALPSDSVSRVHFVVDGKRDGYFVHDRSRHGTTVNGARVGDGYELADGDEISVGIYRATFRAKDEGLRNPTATIPVQAAVHEELLAGADDRVAASRAVLRFVRGPHQGESRTLLQARTSVGGAGATVELEPKLPRGAVYLRVVRGRTMVEPGDLGAWLAGARIREITPVLPGEEVRVGDHGFVVEPTTIEEEGREVEAFGEMVGQTAAMRRLFAVLQRFAGHEAPVLLTGESGTGKELAANGLHEAGPRFEGRFVAVNCAAIADNLVESELFGHEKGAFTGAVARADGAFHHADGGTLFLDEIGEMRLEVQAKLLRALESGEVRRVGSASAEFPDVRVVAATHRNLQDMVRRGTFREDLYFRLAVLTVRLPSLKERRDDIPVIAKALLARHHPTARVSPEAMSALQGYDWPGNIRELRNVLTRAVVMGGDRIGAGDLQFNPWSFDGAPISREPTTTDGGGDDPERKAIEHALLEANGNRTQAARILGIPRSSLLYKLNRYGLMRR